MSGQVPRPMQSIVLITTLLLLDAAVGMKGAAGTAWAGDCLTEPNSPASQGSHWYYRVDPANQRKCWYLRATDQWAEHTAAQKTSDAAPTAPAAFEKHATDSDSAATSLKPGDATAVPLPRVNPQRAIVSAATATERAPKSAEKRSPAPSTKPAKLSAGDPITTASADSTGPHLRGVTEQPSVQLSDQNGSAVSSTINPLAAQLSLSPQMNGQGVSAAPAASSAWPGPPGGAEKVQEPTKTSSEDQAEAVQPTKDAKAPDNVPDSARVSTSTTNTGVAASLTSAPVAIFPVAALGLVVAGFLLRIMVKLFVGRRHRIAVHDHDFEWTNDPHPDESSNDEIADQRDGLTNHLSKSGPRRSSQVDDEGNRDTAPLRIDKISKRERQPFGVDRYETELTDDQRQQPSKWRNDEQRDESTSTDRIDDQYRQGRHHRLGSVAATDDLIDDLQSSLVATRSDYRRRPPFQEDSLNEGDNRDVASADEIREREEGLEQLRRSLDRLLQSPNVP
jgi:hypothetical protein